MIYIASPYSHPDPTIQEHRFLEVRDFTARLLSAGFVVFSPIVYGHEMAKDHHMKGDALTWKRFNFDMIRRCEAIYLLQLPGWKESKGVDMELRLASILDMPVVRYNMEYRGASEGTEVVFELVTHEWDGVCPKVL